MMNISERSVYSAKKLMRMGRPDLEAAVRAGKMSINKALRIAEGRRKPTGLDKLRKAWNSATEDERAVFVVLMESAVKAGEPAL